MGPILYIFGAMYMFVTYWTDKAVLLRGCKRPPSYNTRMAKTAATLMLYACFLHCMIAVVMLGQPCVFPSASVGGATSSVTQGQSSGDDDESTTEMAFLGALWSIWLVTWLFASSLRPIVTVLKHCCC